MKRINVLFVLAAALLIAACAPKQEQQYANRVEKILSEINDPNSDYVVVISHRGDWRNYPENSIPAIESVIRMGVDMMELDVKMTKDSVLVLMHDKTDNARRCIVQFEMSSPGENVAQDFVNEALPLIETQILYAGYRLAEVLNSIF